MVLTPKFPFIFVWDRASCSPRWLWIRCASEVGLELFIVFPSLPGGWDYRHASPYLVYEELRTKPSFMHGGWSCYQLKDILIKLPLAYLQELMTCWVFHCWHSKDNSVEPAEAEVSYRLSQPTFFGIISLSFFFLTIPLAGNRLSSLKDSFLLVH